MNLLRIDKQKHSDSFELGFAVGAVKRMHECQQFASDLSRIDRDQANTGHTIYSAKALMLQIDLHLSDQQIDDLFGPGTMKIINGPRPFP